MGRRKQKQDKQDKQEKVSMAPKQKTYMVDHKSLYMRVNGKMIKMNAGDEITLTEDQAKKMKARGMIKDVGKQVNIDQKTEEEK